MSSRNLLAIQNEGHLKDTYVSYREITGITFGGKQFVVVVLAIGFAGVLFVGFGSQRFDANGADKALGMPWLSHCRDLPALQSKLISEQLITVSMVTSAIGSPQPVHLG